MDTTEASAPLSIPTPGSFPSAQGAYGPELRTVGVSGCGRMGSAFAETLLGSGFDVVAFDRDPLRSKPLLLRSVPVADGLSDLALCDAVISSLPDDDALSAVSLDAEGLVRILKPGAAHVSMGIVSPDLSRRLARPHADVGQGYVAAPVLGNPDLARFQRLFVLAGGPEAAVERVRPPCSKKSASGCSSSAKIPGCPT